MRVAASAGPSAAPRPWLRPALAVLAVLVAMPAAGEWPALSLDKSLEIELETGRAVRLRLDERCAVRGCVLEALQDGVDVVLSFAGQARFDLPNSRHGYERACLEPGDASELEIHASAGRGRLLLRLLPLDDGPRSRARRLLCDGARAYAAGEWPAAIAAFEAAVRAWEDLGEAREAAAALTHLAFTRRRAAGDGAGDGAGDDPLAAFQHALERWRLLSLSEQDAELRREQARVLNEIGFLHHRRGEHRGAEQALRRAVEAAADASDVLARAENNLGLALHALGRPRQAMEAYTRALAGFEAEQDPRREATAASNLAAALQDLGENGAALELHARALEIFRRLGDPAGVARVASNRAVLLRRLGRFQEALDAYGEALHLQRLHGITAAEAATLGNLGELHLLLGETAAARRQLERALALHRQVGEARGEANTLHNLGTALRREGGLVASIGLYRRAVELHEARGDKRSAAASRSSLGVVLGRQGRWREARRALRRAAGDARRFDAPASAALALLRLGELELELGDADAAERALVDAEALARVAGDVPTRAAVSVARARAARAAGELEEAARFGAAAVAEVETLRLRVHEPDLRATFLAARRRAFEVATAVEVERHRRGAPDALERAWLFAERGRARALLDLLGPDVDVSVPNVDAASEAEAIRLLDAAGASRLLDTGTLLVAFVLGEEESHLFCLGPDGDPLEHHALPPRGRIERATHDLLRAWSVLDPGAEEAERRRAAELSRLLLGEITPRLAAAKRLLVVADGALHGLPFAALPYPETFPETYPETFPDALPSATYALPGDALPGDAPPADALIIDHLEVVHLPSASVLARQRERAERATPGPAVVLADPLYEPDSPFARLPFSRLEAEVVARWAGGDTVLLLGEQATPAALESDVVSRAGLLHLASHAVIDEMHPERSGLALTGGTAGLESLRRLELSAEFAVLSGCSTALGRPLLGEGFVGLVHGLLDAGAERVVASLWQVDDRSAAELFERFYAAHFGDGLAPAAALRRAQQELRRSRGRADPWHWAAFVHVGDWQDR